MIKFFLCLLLLLPAFVFAQDDVSDDHNTLPTGILTREQILSGLKLYNYRYVAYAPKSDAIQTIHNVAQPLEIKVVFGDWCKDSKKHIPAFLKTMEFSDNKNISITYINVDRKKQQPADLLAGLNMEKVPTFIVLSQGQEIGRIVETPKKTLEEDLAGMLGESQ